jgi:hypothetical protein
MRYQQGFPARDFLRQFPDDMSRFLARAEEMAEYGTMSLRSHGHALKGRFNELFQFNMRITRAWGFRLGDVFVVLSAAKKRTRGQEADYDFALRLRENYLTGIQDD